jgi:hypothetical protein
MGPDEVLGDGLAVVGLGDGLAVVGLGDGLADVGEGDGDGEFTGGVLGELQADGAAAALLCCVVAPGLAVREPRLAAGFDPRSVVPPPLGLPGPPSRLVAVWPSGLSFSRPTNVPRIPPRAKTPATTSTTAPATARAGRSQAMAGPTDLCGRLPAAQAVMPPRTGRSDRDRRPGAAAGPPAASGAVPAPDGVPDLPALALLRKASRRTMTSQRSTINSLRSSHHCRLSHGSVSRARIFVKPSPTGSI